VSVAASEIARRLPSPMLSRMAAQKDAEHASHAALESVARLKMSQAAGFALAPKSAGAGNSGLARNTPPAGVLRTAQTASSHTPKRKPRSSVYQRDTAVSFIPDGGATHILICEADAEILHSVAPFPSYTRRPQFEVANGQLIVPIASGFITFPNTDVTIRAYLFRDHDLADNLFGIAPL
jgi:hypothetical protein